MKIGILSDIHANLEALQAILSTFQEYAVDKYLCLGDIVGYAANPNECVELIRSLNCPTVMGNHDYVAVGLSEASHFNATARTAILWTQDELTEENKTFLRDLPFEYREDNYLAVHSTPQFPQKWDYIMTLDAAMANMSFFSEQICFIGHSHWPFFLEVGENTEGQLIRTNPMTIQSGYRYMINDGSVGQPRDNNNKSCCVIYDTEAQTVTMLRVPYDIGLTQEKIITAGLPIQLAQRLQNGF